MQAVIDAVHAISCGEGDIMLAGGTESIHELLL